MKSMIKIALALLVPVIMLSACQKTDLQPETSPNSTNQIQSNTYLKLHPILLSLQEYIASNPNDRGATFIPPFVTGDGFGIAKDVVLDFSGPFPVFVSGELGFFNTDLDANDFYRENPDGTVSVHINSTNAEMLHVNFSTGDEHMGSGGKMNMNYTGDVVEFSFPDPNGDPVVIKFIDIANNPNAITWNGVGKVKKDGLGQSKLLKAHLNVTPGGAYANATLTLK